MHQAIRTLNSNGKRHLSPFARPYAVATLHRALADAVRGVGEQLEHSPHAAWEGQSLDGDHVWSRSDLLATGLIVQCVAESLAREGLEVKFDLDNEEVPLAALNPANGYALTLIADPVDGSKAFDSFMFGADVRLPRPASAVSIAASCPVIGESLATALYCFDLKEVFSSLFLGRDESGVPHYAAFRDGALLRPMSGQAAGGMEIEAKRRVLTCEYNSRALERMAQLNITLMDRGLKPVFGGLTGSSATDIINVARTSFAASVDVRALCPEGGSVLYWYDVAGALPIAMGRGLAVHVTDDLGRPFVGSDHPARTRVAYVVARPDVADVVIGAIRELVCPAFLDGAQVKRTTVS